jgi:hypothetical protein
MLDALFFVDRTFASRLKSDLQLSDEQIAKIREAARNETSKLNENESESTGRTSAAGARATETIAAIVGADKATPFADLALARWRAASNGDETGAVPLASPQLSATLDPRQSSKYRHPALRLATQVRQSLRVHLTVLRLTRASSSTHLHIAWMSSPMGE